MKGCHGEFLDADLKQALLRHEEEERDDGVTDVTAGFRARKRSKQGDMRAHDAGATSDAERVACGPLVADTCGQGDPAGRSMQQEQMGLPVTPLPRDVERRYPPGAAAQRTTHLTRGECILELRAIVAEALSHTKLSRFISLNKVVGGGPAFPAGLTEKGMQSSMTQHLLRGAEDALGHLAFQEVDLASLKSEAGAQVSQLLGRGRLVLEFRDICACALALYDSAVKDQCEVRIDGSRDGRVAHPCDGKRWAEMQESVIRLHGESAAPLGIMFFKDKAHLSQNQVHKVDGASISLGNLSLSRVRQKEGRCRVARFPSSRTHLRCQWRSASTLQGICSRKC